MKDKRKQSKKWEIVLVSCPIATNLTDCSFDLWHYAPEGSYKFCVTTVWKVLKRERFYPLTIISHWIKFSSWDFIFPALRIVHVWATHTCTTLLRSRTQHFGEHHLRSMPILTCMWELCRGAKSAGEIREYSLSAGARGRCRLTEEFLY